MFVHDADMSCLRQGDVLEHIPFPLLASQELSVLGRIAYYAGSTPSLSAIARLHRDDPSWLTAQVPIRPSYCRLAML